jgi:hypothetical protein
MAVRNENRFVHHPKDHGGIGPFPPALLTPLCACGLPAFVKQSRHPQSAGRAFYCCQLRRCPSQLRSFIDGCNFYQWMDGDEMFDPSIMLFPYDPWKSCPYDEFVRWVRRALNPPEMTKLEKVDAALNHLVNRPRCHCDMVAVLQLPSQKGMFTPFYRCGQRDYVSAHAMNLFSKVLCVFHIITSHLQHYIFQRGFSACDFEEYNYGPKSHWPSQCEIIEFQAGIKPWPCLRMPDRKCKCGIKAREGVVPSELGYGHYCGNAFGGPNELWVSSLNQWSY